MSKTTKKLGKPTLHIKSSIDVILRPSEQQLKTERYLNLIAQRMFKGRHYFTLEEKEKSFLHEVLNGMNTERHLKWQEDLVRVGLMREVKA